MEAMQKLFQQTLNAKIDPLQFAVNSVGSDLKSFQTHAEQEFKGIKLRADKLEVHTPASCRFAIWAKTSIT